MVYGSGLVNELGLYAGGLVHEQSSEKEAHGFGSPLDFNCARAKRA